LKAAFVKDRRSSKALDVKFDTFKGMVQLNVFVDTQEQKSRAEQIATVVAGVTRREEQHHAESAAGQR